MIESSLRIRDDLVADSASYNMLLTTMPRAELGRPVWGNWTFDPVVEPGMVGVVDPLSGTSSCTSLVPSRWRWTPSRTSHRLPGTTREPASGTATGSTGRREVVDLASRAPDQTFWPADDDVAWAA